MATWRAIGYIAWTELVFQNMARFANDFMKDADWHGKELEAFRRLSLDSSPDKELHLQGHTTPFRLVRTRSPHLPVTWPPE